MISVVVLGKGEAGREIWIHAMDGGKMANVVVDSYSYDRNLEAVSSPDCGIVHRSCDGRSGFVCWWLFSILPLLWQPL